MLIHLFGEPPDVDGAPEKLPRDYTCWPHAPLVDKESRTVTCKRCKKQLDPVDVLLQVAERYDDWVRIGKQITQLRTEIAGLREEEKRVKARTKSHSRKDAEAAVADALRKDFDKRIEVTVRTGEIRRALKRIDQLMGLITR